MSPKAIGSKRGRGGERSIYGSLLASCTQTEPYQTAILQKSAGMWFLSALESQASPQTQLLQMGC